MILKGMIQGDRVRDAGFGFRDNAIWPRPNHRGFGDRVTGVQKMARLVYIGVKA